MKIFQMLIVSVILSAFSVDAAYVAVLETITDQQTRELVSLSDRQYLTNVLREEAVKQLPAVQNFTIMTRENIQQMLPPGKTVEECEGSCLVETGKNIAADYVCQARIGSFDSEFTLSAELYETAGNKLIASFNGQGASMKELLNLIRMKSPDFFRSIKGMGSFSSVGGIGDFSEVGNFSFAGKQKFIVEIVSNPAGALPTIDGKGIPKCISTPCKIQVEEGSHRFVASHDRYEDAESVVDVKMNNQKIELSLSPNFGWLELNPVLEESLASKGKFNVVVDGLRVDDSKIELEMGVHSVHLTHPCFDPVGFRVSIVKNKTEIFNKEMVRGKGGLELNAEYNGVPQTVAVYIDGLEVGSTPYVGEIPLCANVVLKGNGWTEHVYVTPKWHEVVKVTHKLKYPPEGIVLAEEATWSNTQISSNVAQSEVNGINANYHEGYENVGESILTNVNSKKGGRIAGRVVLGIGATAVVTGVILAVIGNNKAREAAEKKSFADENEYKQRRDKVEFSQMLRGIGVGLMIAGTVGIGVSFAF